MSDFGMFEADEAKQAEPRLAARTAGRKLEAAIDEVRAKFGRFLLGATGIDEFGDRWHLSKSDIRAAVEPHVFPNTGTMRRIQNAMKQDWKLAHPYKLAIDHDDAGFGSMPTGDGHRNLDTDETYHPSSGNLVPSPDFEGWKDSVDQGGPEKVKANDFTPGDDGGSFSGNPKGRGHWDKESRRVVAGSEWRSIECPECGSKPGDNCTEGSGHWADEGRFDRTPHELRTDPDVIAEYLEEFSPENVQRGEDQRNEGLRELADAIVRGGPREAGLSPDDRRFVVLESAKFLADNADTEESLRREKESSRIDREAAMLVADIYTDFARSNGLRVASLDTLDHYASTGMIADADYRLLESMIVRTAEDCDDDDKDEDEDGDSEESEDSDDSEGGEAPDFGGSDSDGDDEADTDGDGDHDDEDHHDGEGGGEEYDFGDENSDGEHDDADHHEDEEYDFGGGGGGDVGQTFTVPDEAPELDPRLQQEIPAGDTDGSAPIPPEVIDSLLGLPEGTIEQLLLEEVAQGGGDPGMSGPPTPGGAPQGGGDDFLGQGGDDPEQEPPRVARRRQAGAFEDYRAEHAGVPTKKLIKRYRNGEDGLFEELHYRAEENDRDAAREVLNDYNIDDEDDEGGDGLSPDTSTPSWTYRDGYDGDGYSDGRDDPRPPHLKDSRRRRAVTIDPESTQTPKTDQQRLRQLHVRAQNGDRDAYAELRSMWKQRGWKASRSARRFWAAEGDQEQPDGGDPSGGAQPPQGDPSQGGDPAAMGMDPAAMGGGQPMMPPPGSQAVAPPQPPQPMEDQPAEDALLDTANQAIMQMIDRETQEYQQIIDPLSQALQAIQFAQQVEQAEHPMDVTPPEGTVNVAPSQAPGGQPPMQQQARRQASGWEHRFKPYPDNDEPDWEAMTPREREEVKEYFKNNPPHEGKKRAVLKNAARRQAKVEFGIRNAAALIASRYRLSHGGERMLLEAMGRRNYEHVREALQLLPPEHLQRPEHRAAVRHIGEMFAAENPRFNRDVWMRSVLGPAPGSRLPFDRPRLAGETLVHTPTMDHFEWEGDQPRVDDNNPTTDLPKMKGAARAEDAVSRFQRWTKWRGQNGLVVPGGEGGIHTFMQKTRNPTKPKIGDEASAALHREMGFEPDAPKQAPKTKPVKAVNPTLRKPKAPKATKASRRTAAGFFLDGPRDEDEGRPDPSTLHCSRCGHTAPGSDDRADNLCPGCPGSVMDYRFYGHPTERLVREFKDNPESDYGDTLFHELEHRSSIDDDPHAARAVEDEVSGYGPRGNRKAPPIDDYHARDGELSLDDVASAYRGWDPDDNPGPDDPRIKGASRTASFFTRRVQGWRWDDRLNGYVSKEARAFTCACGERIAAPSYRTCGCGKVWNVYAIGDSHHLASDTADMYVAREIEVRPGVVMANRRMAAPDRWFEHEQEDLHRQRRQEEDDADAWAEKRMNTPHPDDDAYREANRKLAKGGCTCWEGYERVPGTEPCASKSCRKKTGAALFARLAASGMSYEDTMAHIDDVLAAGEGHELHHQPGVTPGDIRTESYEFEDCPNCGGHGNEGADLCRTCDGTGAVGSNRDTGCERCDEVMPSDDLECISTGDIVCPGCADSVDGPVCDDCGYREADHQGGRCVRDALNELRGRHASRRAEAAWRRHLAEIARLADWTKYDDDVDPVAEAYGKPKPASTRIPKQPRDWAKRTPAGTWQGPAIPHKRK